MKTTAKITNAAEKLAAMDKLVESLRIDLIATLENLRSSPLRPHKEFAENMATRHGYKWGR